MSHPGVGVVISAGARPESLKRTIESVRAQDYPGPMRIIVVFDQARPDWRLAVRDERAVTVLANWRQPGLAGARNTGIVALDTELVAFCGHDDVWHRAKLRKQIEAMTQAGATFTTCGIEVDFDGLVHPRLAGAERVAVDQLARSRMAMLHSSTFLADRSALLPGGTIGLVAEDAPGSQHEDWDLLIRAARLAPIVHVDEPLVRVKRGRTSMNATDYSTKISSLRWMMARHPEMVGCPPGAARIYGQLACWSAAAGDRANAWRYTKQSVKANWKEPRALIALAALSRVTTVERVLGTLRRRGLGI